ncbi:MAG: hypothetical protein ACPLYF_02710 [Fervidobacterium sp.]
MSLGLEIPKEKGEIKKKILELKGRVNSGLPFEYDSLAVWYGNIIPSYLWESWKNELKKKGWNWQKFLKLLSYSTREAVLYVEGEMSWEAFVSNVINLLESPIGEAIRKR